SLDERDGRLEFDADLFEPATVGSWLRGLVTLLEAALAAPDTPVGELPLGETVLVGPAGEDGPPVHQLLARAAPDALAVMAADGIYTSGSTGRPKGVVVPHRSPANLVGWYRRALSPFERVAQLSALSFDVLACEVMGAWASGGTVCIADEETRRDPALLAR